MLLTRREFGLAALAAGALAARRSQAAEKTAADKIHIGVLPLASHSPTFIALAKGYFTDAGLDADFVTFEAAEPMAVAIAAGDVDFGVTAITGASSASPTRAWSR